MNIATCIANAQKPFFSLEFFPPKEKSQWASFFETAKKLQSIDPLFASVTYGAGGSSQDNTLEITRQLRSLDFLPMAHLTCIGANSQRIDDFLDKLQDAGVHNILALRGDAPKDLNSNDVNHEFSYAEDLVRYVRNKYKNLGIGVAGYPAPHLESPSFASDRAYMASKVQAGADFIITQLFFDVREYFDLVDCLKAKGINTPVIPGILPVQSLSSIRRVLKLCGANIPGSLYLQLEEAHAQGGEEAVRQVGLEFAIKQIVTLLNGGAKGIHLYTLNRANLCLRIVEEVRKYI